MGDHAGRQLPRPDWNAGLRCHHHCHGITASADWRPAEVGKQVQGQSPLFMYFGVARFRGSTRTAAFAVRCMNLIQQ